MSENLIEGMLSVVLPAYNEEANLEIVVREALAAFPQSFTNFEIIIVDDGSKDRTGEIADNLAKQNPGKVRVVHYSPNRGYGAALTSGFNAAVGDYLMFMDSDRQFKPEDIALFTPYIGKFDIVAGYRKKRKDPFYRFLIGYTFNTIVTLLFDIHLRDIDCGFKVFRAELLKGMQLTSPGALINTEIHAKANRQKCSLVEVGVNHYPRITGDQSGASIKVIARAMVETIKLWARLRSYRAPLGAGGLKHGYPVTRRPLVAIPPVSTNNIIGVLSTGLVLRMVAKKYLKKNTKKR